MTASGSLAARDELQLQGDDDILYIRSKLYPKQTWYCIACFVATVSFFQFGSWVALKLGTRMRSKSRSDSEGGSHVSPQHFSIRHIPRAIINAYRVMAFRWTISIRGYTLNLAEVFVTCAYIIILFTWNFINTTNLEGGKLDLQYWKLRAGDIATAQLPLVTVTGTKNNVLAYLVGIPEDKLNYIHRMTARVVFVLLWVHSGGELVQLPWKVWSDYCWYFIPMGLLGMVAFSLVCLVSLRPIRSKAYELFFVIHFFGVLVFLLGGYYHAKIPQSGS